MAVECKSRRRPRGKQGRDGSLRIRLPYGGTGGSPKKGENLSLEGSVKKKNTLLGKKERDGKFPDGPQEKKNFPPHKGQQSFPGKKYDKRTTKKTSFLRTPNALRFWGEPKKEPSCLKSGGGLGKWGKQKPSPRPCPVLATDLGLSEGKRGGPFRGLAFIVQKLRGASFRQKNQRQSREKKKEREKKKDAQNEKRGIRVQPNQGRSPTGSQSPCQRGG